MAKVKSTIRLRNKFHNIELSLNDSESNNSKYKTEVVSQMSQLEINKNFQVASQEKILSTEKIPKLYSSLSFLLKTINILSCFVFKKISIVFVGIFSPMIEEVRNTAAYTFRKIISNKKKNEKKILDYLAKIEDEISKEKAQQSMTEVKKNSEYEIELAKVFVGFGRNIVLLCEEEEFEKVNQSLEFDISLYEMICKQLLKSNMIANLKSLDITTNVNKKIVENTIEFELNVQSEKWSRLFSRKISSNVLEMIKNYNGEVRNVHLINTTKKTEKFVFIFIHQRLDLFMDSIPEEVVQKEVGVSKVYIQAEI